MREQFERIRRSVLEKAAAKHENRHPEKYPWITPVLWVVVVLIAIFLMIWAKSPK